MPPMSHWISRRLYKHSLRKGLLIIVYRLHFSHITESDQQLRGEKYVTDRKNVVYCTTRRGHWSPMCIPQFMIKVKTQRIFLMGN